MAFTLKMELNLKVQKQISITIQTKISNLFMCRVLGFILAHPPAQYGHADAAAHHAVDQSHAP